MDDVSERRLRDLYPPFAQKIREMADALAAEGIYIRVVQGLRTVAEQDALYAQGRTAPGKIVTNARGDKSWHSFALAADCVPSKNGPGLPYVPDWDTTRPAWKRMIEVGKGLGLTSGADWKTLPDMPHFQMTGNLPENAPPDGARQVAEANGIESIWNSAFGVQS